MKKCICYLLLIFSVFSCVRDDLNPRPYLTADFNQSYAIRQKDVLTYLSIIDKNLQPKTKTLQYNLTPVIDNKDTLFYVINKTRGGWYLISGDMRTPEILASGDEGSFDWDKLNPNADFWMNEVLDYLRTLKSDTTLTKSESNIAPVWKKIRNRTDLKTRNPGEGDGFYQHIHTIGTTISSNYGPYITTKWGQGIPWNSCVPYKSDSQNRCYVGCVAVSGAQMLYFLHYKWNTPASFYSIGSCSGYSENGSNNYSFSFSNSTSGIWDNMAKNSSDITRSWHASAILMGYVGLQVDMKYKNDGSGANDRLLRENVFPDLGIYCNYSDYNHETAINSLINGMPVIIGAYRNRVQIVGIPIYSNGHSWIIDGYEKSRTHFTHYYRWRLYSDFNDNGDDTGDHPIDFDENDVPTKYDYVDQSTSITHFLRMNWGYDGQYDNARYSIYGNWEPANSGRNYTYDKKMIHNFRLTQ